jgi:hypothetical protein
VLPAALQPCCHLSLHNQLHCVQMLASGGWDKSVKVWDLRIGRAVRRCGLSSFIVPRTPSACPSNPAQASRHPAAASFYNLWQGASLDCLGLNHACAELWAEAMSSSTHAWCDHCCQLLAVIPLLPAISRQERVTLHTVLANSIILQQLLATAPNSL